MGVCVVWVEHLRLAHLLQSTARFQNNLDRHSVKNLFAIRGIISEIDNLLDTSYSSGRLCPLMNCICNLLDWSPKDKDLVLWSACELSKVVCLHPLTYLLNVLHRQTPVHCLIAAKRAIIHLSEGQWINLFVLGISQDQITPHLELPFPCFHVFLHSKK